MIPSPDLISSDLPPTARTRVRVPRPMTTGRIFPGWGPDLGR